MNAKVRALLTHLTRSPWGWHGASVIVHRSSTEADQIAWLRELERLRMELDRDLHADEAWAREFEAEMANPSPPNAALIALFRGRP